MKPAEPRSAPSDREHDEHDQRRHHRSQHDEPREATRHHARTGVVHRSFPVRGPARPARVARERRGSTAPLALALVLLAFVAAACSSAPPRDTGPAAQYRVAGLTLERWLSEKPDLVLREQHGWELWHPRGLSRAEVDQLAARVERARAAVERELGSRFARPVSIYLPPAGAVSDLRRSTRRTNGFSARYGDEVFALVRAPYPESTLRHELVHCHFNALDRQTSWIEEGLAELLSDDGGEGLRTGLLEVLRELGPVPAADLAHFDDGRDPDLRRRATAWLVVYWLHARRGLALAEIAALDSTEDALGTRAAFESWIGALLEGTPSP